MQQYKFAIIIPSWNCSKYIGEMLDSILANSFTNWKCFVVDDQSTDGSREVIQAYHEKDERIVLKVRDREPKGAQTCRNIGFELTEEAEYVMWFDADDVIAPYCFEQRVEYMDRHPELDFGVFPAKNFKEEMWEMKDCCDVFGYPFFEDNLKAMLDRTLPMVGWTNIYRRSSVRKYHLLWDTKILSLQDSDWNIQAILKGCKFDFGVKEGAKIDYFYRIGMCGISGNISSMKHSNSHIHYIAKTSSSLSLWQRIKYQNEVKGYYLWIGKMLMGDMKEFFSFMLQRWFLSHPWFGIRFFVLYHLSGKFESVLFPVLCQKERHNIVCWRKQMEEEKKKIMYDLNVRPPKKNQELY